MGNFWSGFILGSFLLGGNKGGEQEGCLSKIFYTALGLLSLMVAIVVGHDNFLKGLITFFVFPMILMVVIRLVLFLLKKFGLFAFDKIKSKVMATDIVEKEINDLFAAGQYTLALEKAEQIAEKSPFAADVAGVCYNEGRGCSKDSQKALSFFSMAKDKNFEAAYHYGATLAFGSDDEEKKKEGFEYLKKAALSGQYDVAGADYGYAMFKGMGCEKNQAEGLRRLRIASDSGFLSAKYFLGCILCSGEDGTQVDKEGGVRLLREAADAGDEMAKEYLVEIGMA